MTEDSFAPTVSQLNLLIQPLKKRVVFLEEAIDLWDLKELEPKYKEAKELLNALVMMHPTLGVRN